MTSSNVEIQKTSVKESRENYFEAIENEFKAGNGELVEIADRKEKEWKLSFFDKVKDFFENPYAGIKYLSSRIFGREITKFMYELKETKDNLSKAKDNVMSASETAIDKTKKVIESIPEDIKKNVPIAGSVIASAIKVKDYFVKNAIKASEMPEDEAEKMVWWKEIMKSAGVKESKLVENTLLELLAEKSNWTDVRDKIAAKATGKEFEEKVDKELETGELYKDWPFTGEKLGVKSEKVFASLQKNVTDIGSIIRDNPNMTGVLTGYLGYKVGLSKGLNATAITGKALLTTALYPLKKVKNNPKKVILLLIGTRLMQQNTRWDEAVGKIMYNTPLPKDYEEFNRVISNHPAYKELASGLSISRQEFDDAMGIIDSEEKLTKTLDEVVESITVKNIAKGALDLAGQTPQEKLKYENFRGMNMVKSLVLNEKNSEKLKEKLGENYQSYSDLLEKMVLATRVDENGEIPEELVKEFNTYSAITRYSINTDTNYVKLTFQPLDAEEPAVTKRIGVNANLDSDMKQKLATSLKIHSQSELSGWLEDAGDAYALGDAYFGKIREMLGVSGENLNDSIDKIAGDMNEKVKSGEAVVAKEGENFFYKYGKEYILLPVDVGWALGKAMLDEDYEVMDAAVVYTQGLTLVTVVGASKSIANGGLDAAYSLAVRNELGRRVKGKNLREGAKFAIQTITYPISKPVGAYKDVKNAYKVMRENGLLKMMQRSSWGEMASSLRNINDGMIKALGDYKASKLGENGRKSLEAISDVRNNVMSIRDAKINTSNLARRFPDGTTDKKLIRRIVDRFQSAGMTEDLLKIFGKTDSADLKSLNRISADQLKKLLIQAEVALDVEKRILRSMEPVSLIRNLSVVEKTRGITDQIKNLSAIKNLSEWRKMRKAQEAARISKTTKLGKISTVAGVVAIGGVLLNEYLSEDEKSSNESTESKKKAEEILKKNPSLAKTVEAIMGAEIQIMKKVMDPKKAKEYQTETDTEKRIKIITEIKNDYLETYNELLNGIFNSRYKGSLEDIVEIFKLVDPKTKIQVKESTFGSEKYLNIGLGSIQIMEKNGKLSLGRMGVDLLAENMETYGQTTEETLKNAGKDLVPLVGTYRDFEKSYKAHQVGNTEKSVGDFFYGVSSLASDIALPVKAGGVALKVLGKSGKIKRLHKLLPHIEKMSSVSSSVGKGGFAGGTAALAFMGYDIFDGDINTYTNLYHE